MRARMNDPAADAPRIAAVIPCSGEATALYKVVETIGLWRRSFRRRR